MCHGDAALHNTCTLRDTKGEGMNEVPLPRCRRYVLSVHPYSQDRIFEMAKPERGLPRAFLIRIKGSKSGDLA